MTRSMKYLFVVAVLAGGFEAVSAVWFNAPDRTGQALAGVFAVLLLGCAWAMRARQSRIAASVIGVLLLLDVAGVPFYAKASLTDWVVQLTFGAVGLVGIVAWVNVLRAGRRHRDPVAA